MVGGRQESIHVCFVNLVKKVSARECQQKINRNRESKQHIQGCHATNRLKLVQVVVLCVVPSVCLELKFSLQSTAKAITLVAVQALVEGVKGQDQTRTLS